MQIRRPRGVTVPQLMLVTAIGFLGGVYIWKPLILKYKNENQPENSEAPTATNSTTAATITTNSTKWGKQGF